MDGNGVCLVLQKEEHSQGAGVSFFFLRSRNTSSRHNGISILKAAVIHRFGLTLRFEISLPRGVLLSGRICVQGIEPRYFVQ